MELSMKSSLENNMYREILTLVVNILLGSREVVDEELLQLWIHHNFFGDLGPMFANLIVGCINSDWSGPKCLHFTGNHALVGHLDTLNKVLHEFKYTFDIGLNPLPKWLLSSVKLEEGLNKMCIWEAKQREDIRAFLSYFKEVGIPPCDKIKMLQVPLKEESKRKGSKTMTEVEIQYMYWIHFLCERLVMAPSLLELKPLTEDEKAVYVPVTSVQSLPEKVKASLLEFMQKLYGWSRTSSVPYMQASNAIRRQVTGCMLNKNIKSVHENTVNSLRRELAYLPDDVLDEIVGNYEPHWMEDLESLREALMTELCQSVWRRVWYVIMPHLQRHLPEDWDYRKCHDASCQSQVRDLFLLGVFITHLFDGDEEESANLMEMHKMLRDYVTGAPLPSDKLHPILREALKKASLYRDDAKKLRKKKNEQRRRREERKRYLCLSGTLIEWVEGLSENDGRFSFVTLLEAMERSSTTNSMVHNLTFVFAVCTEVNISGFKEAVLEPLHKVLEVLVNDTSMPERIRTLKLVVEVMMNMKMTTSLENQEASLKEVLRFLVNHLMGSDLSWYYYVSMMKDLRALQGELHHEDLYLDKVAKVDLMVLMKRLLEKVFDRETLEKVVTYLRTVDVVSGMVSSAANAIAAGTSSSNVELPGPGSSTDTSLNVYISKTGGCIHFKSSCRRAVNMKPVELSKVVGKLKRCGNCKWSEEAMIIIRELEEVRKE